jgi:hypothetical protein
VADVVVETDEGEGSGGKPARVGVLGLVLDVGKAFDGLDERGNTLDGSTDGKCFRSNEASLSLLAASSLSSSSLCPKLEEENSGDESVSEGVLMPASTWRKTELETKVPALSASIPLLFLGFGLCASVVGGRGMLEDGDRRLGAAGFPDGALRKTELETRPRSSWRNELEDLRGCSVSGEDEAS